MREVKVLLFALLAGGTGCSSGLTGDVDAQAATSCPNAPSHCLRPVPSYRTVIVPILQQHCIPCHNPKGSAGHSEATYEDVYLQRSPMLDQVAGCGMPPSGYPIHIAERGALLDWFVCGAPDN